VWIHVPPTYLASAQGSGASSSELKQPWLEELARSATWKTKSVSLQSLRRVWKTVPSIQRLSGLTSEPSIQNRGVDSYRSWLAAFHASHTAWRETSSEKMTQESFQEKSSELQPDLDTQLSFSKMFQELCASTTKTSDQDFKAWATPLRKDSLRRRKQAHLTEDKGSSSSPTPVWMTPNTMDSLAPKSQEALDYEHDTARQGRSNPNNLRDQASVQEGITNWPTPNTRDHHAQGAGMNPASRSVALSTLLQKHQAANWPTPASRDWKGFDPPGKQNTKSDPKMYLSIPQAPATKTDGLGSSTDGPSLPQPSAKNHRCSPKCRRLNANFAAHLMGLPKNYLLKSCCGQSAMESFQRWQHSLSEHLARL